MLCPKCKNFYLPERSLKEKEPIAAPSPPQYEQKPQSVKESILDFVDRTLEMLARW